MFQMALDKAKEHYGDAIWILDKAKEYQKVIMCFIVYRKVFDYISYNKLSPEKWKSQNKSGSHDETD